MVAEGMPHSNVMFTCDDIQQTHAALVARGVRLPTPPSEMHFGWWSVFEDDEGTRYALSLTARDRFDRGGEAPT